MVDQHSPDVGWGEEGFSRGMDKLIKMLTGLCSSFASIVLLVSVITIFNFYGGGGGGLASPAPTENLSLNMIK